LKQTRPQAPQFETLWHPTCLFLARLLMECLFLVHAAEQGL